MKLLTCDDDEQRPLAVASLFRKLIKVYLVLSIPVAAIFLCSSSTRFAAAQALARGSVVVVPIGRVFCGDEITRDGGVWGWRIAANPLGTLNLAEGKSTSWQLVQQVQEALAYRPNTIYAMTGRFDVEDPAYSEDRTIEHLKKVVAMTDGTGIHFVLTLSPYGTSSERNSLLTSLNARIEAELTDTTILDLNKTIAPQGTLDSQFTDDGVHLNEAAYTAWANLMKSGMSGSDAFRPNDSTRPPRGRRR